MSTVRFKATENSEFYTTIKNRVDSYFRENNLSKFANREMHLKSILFLGGVVMIYFMILSGYFNKGQMLILAALLGVFKVLVGFNLSHDAIHGSYSPNSKINHLLGLTFNFLGANNYIWSISHNMAHHSYTNIPGHDEDIEIAPGIIRASPFEKHTFIMKYQHYYAFLLYGLALILWVFKKDFVKFFSPTIGQIGRKHPRKQLFNLFFFKFLYIIIFMVVPLLLLPISLGEFLIGFLVMHFSAGLIMGVVFQLAHLVEGTDFPVPDSNDTIQEAWAIHQMRTTANFATESKLTCFLLGGLNMQIEHHLFPNICHVHYPAISKIVRETAREYKVPYIVHGSLWKAIKSHYNILKKFGREECLHPQVNNISTE